jgi:putative salt-induced outer membrane protein YdiY
MRAIGAWFLAVGSVAACLLYARSADADQGWTHSLTVGGTFTSGNSDTRAANVGGRTEYASNSHECRIGLDGNYGVTEVENDAGRATSQVTARTVEGSLNYKRLRNRRYAYTDNKLFHDDVADIQYRLTTGAGGGFRLVNGARVIVAFELGGAYILEDLEGGGTDDTFSLRVAARHDLALSETAMLWESLEYLVSTEDQADYLFNGEAGIDVALNSRVSLRVMLQNRYDNTPSGDRERNDATVIGSLRVHL